MQPPSNPHRAPKTEALSRALALPDGAWVTVRRRAMLAAVGAVAAAGCGWSQDPGKNRAGGSEETPRPTLAESEGGDGPIEVEAGQLLLTIEDLDSGGWRETDVQTTKTCSTFQRGGEGYSFGVKSCAEVFDDEAAASEEFQGAVDRGPKLLEERADREPEIGDETAVFTNDGGFPRTEGPNIRLLFRDTNATGRIDFTEEIRSDTAEVPEYGIAHVSAWGARMHGRWRG